MSDDLSGDMLAPSWPNLVILFIISRRALAREGDYKMHPVRACVRVLVCHADFSKTATATDFL